MALLLAIWALPARAQTGSPSSVGTLAGTVETRLGDSRRHLRSANVLAWSDAWRGSAETDSLGRYRIEDVPAGEIRLRATHPGHESLELAIILPAGSTVHVDLELEGTPIPLATVRVRGTRRPAEEIPGAETTTDRSSDGLDAVRSELSRASLDIGPGIGHGGVASALDGLPGQDTGDPADVLLMRGSATDLKLILLDGVPVYTPFHVAGLLKTFEPELLDQAVRHFGGAPARYDGGLTHVLDVRTRAVRTDRVRSSASFDLLSASLAVEAPITTGVGLLASGRSLHGAGESALGAARPYGYRDVLAVLDATPAEPHALRVTGFANEERVHLDFPQSVEDARWSNQAGAVNHRWDAGDLRVGTTLGGSLYRATLPLPAVGADGNRAPDAVLATAETGRARALLELSWGTDGATRRVGLSHDRTRATFVATSLAGSARSATGGRTSTTGAFVDVTQPIAAGVTFRGGVRVDRFSGSVWRTAPRGSLAVELGADALLTLSAGRYHQPLLSGNGDVDRALAEVVGEGAGASRFLPVGSADHLVVSLDQRIDAVLAIGLEGFWKRYEGLFGPGADPVLNSGMEMRVIGSGARASGWFGYGLSWFWSEVDLSGGSPGFSGRHLLNAGVTGRLLGPLHGEARLSYGAGLPGASVPLPRSTSPIQDEAGGSSSYRGANGGEPRLTDGNGHPDPAGPRLTDPFLRMDLELHAEINPNWGGRTWSIRPYLRLLNALDRRDGLFFALEPWRADTLRPLAERPVIPLLGVALSF